LRIAFLGVTHPHARAWADAATEHPETTIVAVHDPDADAARLFAERYGSPVLDRLDLEPVGLDAVVVDGRNDQAHDLAMAALTAGLPVFIEKTGGMDAGELGRVADEADRRGLLTQMGYFLRYSDAVQEAADALAGGRLGRLALARFHAAIPHGAWTSMGAWFGDPAGVVGPFMEAGCHMIDIVRRLLGEPSSVAAREVRWEEPPNHAEDALAATLVIGDSVVAVDLTAHEANPWNANWSIELYGSRESLRAGLLPSWTSTSSGTHLWTPGRPAPSDEEGRRAAATTENAELMRRGWHAFVAALRGEGTSPVDAASGAETLALIERVYRAARH
jgi:predicted dehydrogenase